MTDIGTEIGALIAFFATIAILIRSIYSDRLETIQKMERIYKVHMPDDLTFAQNDGEYKETTDKFQWLKLSAPLGLSMCDKFYITACCEAF